MFPMTFFLWLAHTGETFSLFKSHLLVHALGSFCANFASNGRLFVLRDFFLFSELGVLDEVPHVENLEIAKHFSEPNN